MRIGIQLYTLRNLDDPLTDTIRRVADLGFEGVEFAGFGEHSPTEIADVLEETGLAATGAHETIDAIEDGGPELREQYATVGCRDLIVPTYDGEAFTTEVGARDAGRRLSAAASNLATDDVTLHYHNHTFEFTELADGTAFDAFAAAAEDVRLEIDTGLANHAGVDPIELLERYGDRVTLVHLTDSEHASDDPQTKHMDLGTGDLDIPACVEAAREADAEWITYENGLTDDPVTSVEAAAATLSELV